MNLTTRQRTNIRHFIYYLVNGTLEFDLLNNRLSVNYQDYLINHPELFYKACCVFINQEVMLNPPWPQVKRLAEFISLEIEPQRSQEFKTFETWELDFQVGTSDLSNSFKSVTKWFIGSVIVDRIGYTNYIQDGASFVEQCFAIWANVIEIANERVINNEHALTRVAEYIKSYYNPSYSDNLEEWECELH